MIWLFGPTEAQKRKLRDHDDAYKFARTLADALLKKHFPEAKEVWRPSEQLPELVLQIDNMTCNLIHPKTQTSPQWVPNPGQIWPFLPGTEIIVIWGDGTETYPQPPRCFEKDWGKVAFFRIVKGEWPFRPSTPKKE